MTYLFRLLLLVSVTNVFAENSDSYTSNYIYGSQPIGTYVGGFSQNNYDGVFIPYSGASTFYTPQSGIPMEMSQFIQGQEQLMQSKSKEQQQRKIREKEIQEKLIEEYQKQIHG